MENAKVIKWDTDCVCTTHQPAPASSYIEALTPVVAVFEDGASCEDMETQRDGLKKCGTYIQWNISHKKEQNNATSRNMDGPRNCHTELK